MRWPRVQLAEVAEIERNAISADQIGGGMMFVGLENIATGGQIIEVKPVSSGEIASTKFKFDSRHVLYGKLRPYLAKIAAPSFEGICSTDILPILPGLKLCRGYLLHFLRQPSMVDYATSRSEGVNLPRLSPRALAAFELPLPPLNDQERIAAILDAADALRAKRRATLAKLDTLAQSIFVEMFGDPVSNPKNFDESLVLGDVTEIVSGITKGRKLNGQPVREIPYLAVVNVQDHALNLDIIKRIEATDEEIDRYKLRYNDLLLTEGGDPDKLGRGTLWKNELSECIHQNHVFRVRLSSREVDPLFLNWLIGSRRGKKYFLRSAKQTTGIASINMTQLRRFPMLIPPIDLQREFANRIAVVENRRAEHLLADHKHQVLFESLQHHAFRGEL